MHNAILVHQMIDVMRRFSPVSSALALQLSQIVHFMDCRAGNTILNYKEIQKFVWFQLKGTSAEMTRDMESSEESTSWFWFVGDFLHTTPGFFSQQPSVSSIVTLEDSSFIAISVEDFTALKKQFFEAEQLIEKLRDNCRVLRTQHLIDMKRTALERTRNLYYNHPNLLKICSRKQLASFLNMSPDTLTRAMKKLNGI
ncbi:cAMP-binding domain of CRP or a regulatory subunit of cAMP-dependent protein kinases [Pedobacter steynii]|uniref:cAMP-binding domain of CRP or a regulatory subunit of cAMP-dependent protein kinases n=2 Tax=Pedobacter steynii TaxID=430522 RepID=A0A1G9L6T8_9SPHI|nr:Crp/Fnr family transcriptional regulator [Pedobacter steynii]SDL57699.1 cAMP-binding domain of CRP or a regulatory subunit of cAMP-dependent protein kinases [Pedobacter steynii]